MKIAYILNSGNFGGMEKHVLDLCQGMVQQSHQVFVWCPPGDMVEAFEKSGAKVTQAEIGLDIDPGYIKRLAKFLKENEIEIVHAHELKAAVNSLIAGKKAGVKVRISHTHTPISEWQISGLKKRLNLFVYPRVVNKLATYEIALTLSRKNIKIEEGIKEEKLRVLENPNAVNVSRLSLGSNIKEQYRKDIMSKLEIAGECVIWGCLGRLTEEKGHKILIEAFKTFIQGMSSEESNKHHLVLAGGGPLEEGLKNQIEKNKLESKVTITGKLSPQEVIRYYSAFDFFVHPSLAEGFGLVLIEAMATNTPVLASDLEVFKEVGDDTILYFKKGEPQDLARVMQEVISNKHDLNLLTRRAHKRVVDNYSFDKFIDCYHKFYLELLQE